MKDNCIHRNTDFIVMKCGARHMVCNDCHKVFGVTTLACQYE